MNEAIEYTEEELRITIKVLKRLRAEDQDVDPDKYTTDEIVDLMIDYFQFCQYHAAEADDPTNAYERAMKGIAP